MISWSHRERIPERQRWNSINICISLLSIALIELISVVPKENHCIILRCIHIIRQLRKSILSSSSCILVPEEKNLLMSRFFYFNSWLQRRHRKWECIGINRSECVIALESDFIRDSRSCTDSEDYGILLVVNLLGVFPVVVELSIDILWYNFLQSEVEVSILLDKSRWVAMILRVKYDQCCFVAGRTVVLVPEQ